MLYPRVLLTLAFKEMLYDNSPKMGNPVPPSAVALLWMMTTGAEFRGVALNNNV